MAGPTVMVIGLDVAQCASKTSLLTTAQVGEVIVKRNKKNEYRHVAVSPTIKDGRDKEPPGVTCATSKFVC